MNSFNKYTEAVNYATAKHEGQIRRGIVNQPYIVHPLNVSKILERTGEKDSVVIAGILHDVVEDTPTKIEEITKKFGKRVSRIVEGVTEKGINMTWDQRLKAYLEKVKNSPRGAKAVCAADKIDNMISIINCIKSKYNIFEHMHAGKEKQIKKFETVLKNIEKDINPKLKALYKKTLRQLIRVTKNL